MYRVNKTLNESDKRSIAAFCFCFTLIGGTRETAGDHAEIFVRTEVVWSA
jgi:hypothetical protein